MLRECARGWRIYFQIFFAVSDLPFRGSVREFPLYLLGFIDFQDLAGQRIVDDWGRFEDKKFSLLASRCGWLGTARARAVGVREECGRSANGAVTRRAVASTSGAAGGAAGGAVTRQARLGRLGSLGGPAMPPSLRLRSNEAAGMRLMRAWLRLIR